MIKVTTGCLLEYSPVETLCHSTSCNFIIRVCKLPRKLRYCSTQLKLWIEIIQHRPNFLSSIPHAVRRRAVWLWHWCFRNSIKSHVTTAVTTTINYKELGLTLTSTVQSIFYLLMLFSPNLFWKSHLGPLIISVISVSPITIESACNYGLLPYPFGVVYGH